MRIETLNEEPGRERRKLFFDCPYYLRRLTRWAEDKRHDPKLAQPPRECHVLLKLWPINAPTWTWDGNMEAPTLSPSIQCGDCGWHGFIVKGEVK